MPQKLIEVLDNLIVKLHQTSCDQQQALTTEFSSDWISPCQKSQPDQQDMIEWQPTLQNPTGDFAEVEKALDMVLHPDIKLFFSRYWSGSIDIHSARGNLQLLQAWNVDDFARLQQNLIGHILMKQRLKQPITLFFAVTDEEDFIISLDNQTGEVVLEQVGCLPKETLAPDLASFLNQLTPII